MSDAVKVMGIGCTTVALCVALLVAPDMPQVWGPLIGILGGLLGAPLIARSVKRKLGMKIDEDDKLTWDEWHMIASGWGDGVAFNKAEKIPTIQETPGDYKGTDFYAILAREVWYYKFGLALGRLTWVLIVASLLMRFL